VALIPAPSATASNSTRRETSRNTPDCQTYKPNSNGTPRIVTTISGASHSSIEKTSNAASTRNSPCRKGQRSDSGRCGNSELVNSGKPSGSREDTAKALGRSRCAQ